MNLLDLLHWRRVSPTAKPQGAERGPTFAEFIRNASSTEKKRVYSRVLKRATERQRAVLESRAK